MDGVALGMGAHWDTGHNPFSQAFPSGEGGSRVSRKRETDEGLHAF